MNRLRLLAILMGITILGITGFQLYWLKNNYDRERQALEIKTYAAFRQTILHLQSSKLKLEKANFMMDSPTSSHVYAKIKKHGNKPLRNERKEPTINMLNLLQEKMKDSIWTDSLGKKTIMISLSNGNIRLLHDSLHGLSDSVLQATIKAAKISKKLNTNLSDSLKHKGPGKATVEKKDVVTITYNRNGIIVKEDISGISVENEFGGKKLTDLPQDNAIFRFLYNVDSLSLKDSVTIREITTAFAARLKEDKIAIPFTVIKKDSINKFSEAANDITIGLLRPVTYRLSLHNTFGYIVKKLTLPILFSIFLVGITIISFILLYRSLLKQHRLAAMKNEFISNITHELKTPIATVGVAIEALKFVKCD